MSKAIKFGIVIHRLYLYKNRIKILSFHVNIEKKTREIPINFTNWKKPKGEKTKVFINLFCPNLAKKLEMMMP